MGIFMEKNGRILILLSGLALGLFGGFKYLLPLTGPFIPAFLVVHLSFPGLKKLSGKLYSSRLPASRFWAKPEILLAVLLVFAAVLFTGGAWLAVRKSGEWVPAVYESFGQLERQMEQWLVGGCGLLEKNFGIDAQDARQMIVEKMDVFIRQLQVNLWPTAAKQSFSYLKKIGKAAAFGGIGLIAAILLCKEYEKLEQKMTEQTLTARIWQLVCRLVYRICGYGKAQLIIITTTAGIASAGLWIGRVDGAFGWGLLAGILDALPFIGTGVILLPLALWQLLYGKVWSMTAVLASFVLCIVMRELLEPKLLGKQLGISPVIMLFSVYAGMKVFGIPGLFLGPLYVMVLVEVIGLYRELYGPGSDQSQASQQKQPESQGDGT